MHPQAVKLASGMKVANVMCKFGPGCNRAADGCPFGHDQAKTKFAYPTTTEECEKIRDSKDDDGQ